MAHIEVRRCGEATTQQRWRFWVNVSHHGEIKVVLDAYWFETRPSTRHKFRPAQFYNRIDSRESNLAVHDVPQPKDVRYEVLAKAVGLIKIIVSDARGVEAPFAPEPIEMEWDEGDQKWIAAGLIKPLTCS